MASPAFSAGGEVPVSALPGSEVLDQHRSENFPVALRILGREERQHLMAIYGFARLVDEIGDEAEGDRGALLDTLERDLERAFETGEPLHPLLRGLVPSIRALEIAPEPFVRLIEANRRDQSQLRYARFGDLLDYCRDSANPIGVLVLHVFRAYRPALEPLSDAICTGLQLAEHWQDVAEDYAKGRVYLPAEDLERFGVSEAALAAGHADPAFRSLLRFEVDRARVMLERGQPLIAQLRGQARLAVCGYAAGGHAALDAIEARGYDVLRAAPRTRRSRVARHWLRLLWSCGR